MARDPVEDNSVSKSLRILQLLACHESMRVTELSRELGVAASTAHRLLNIMRGHDFVEQDIGSPRYRLGPAALKLGRPARSHPHLLPISHPYLERLSADLNETVNLVVLDGPDALFLLACLPYQSLRALYPDQLRRVTKNTLPDLQALQQELQKVREHGYALNLGEHLAEVYAIGVPVKGADGRPVAAVTVAGPATRWNRRTLRSLAPQVTGTAALIARVLAGQGTADGSADESAPAADAHVRA